MRAAVIVLGDIGRSPRMQYHALALAASGAAVDLIGHAGTFAGPDLERHPSIRIHRMPEPRRPPPAARGPWFLVRAAWRGMTETARLLHLLVWSLPRPDVILVQTPPAIPVLIVSWLAARMRGARFVIDWHNFGDRMLAMRLGGRHWLVRASGWYERAISRRADAHLVVSEAMRRVLVDEWRVRRPIGVLYDRPAARFQPLAGSERLAARRDLLRRVGVDTATNAAIAISPTSWTADEDFDLLFEALQKYDRFESGRCLIVVITGDGPRRLEYERRAAGMTLTRVMIRTAWLEADEYPRLLAAGDVGISLHRSASGVDLPMKVADCLGAGLPVLAFDYGLCLREQIEAGVTGLLFADAGILAQQLAQLLGPESHRLDRLRAAAVSGPRESWAHGWEREARTLISGASVTSVD